MHSEKRGNLKRILAMLTTAALLYIPVAGHAEDLLSDGSMETDWMSDSGLDAGVYAENDNALYTGSVSEEGQTAVSGIQEEAAAYGTEDLAPPEEILYDSDADGQQLSSGGSAGLLSDGQTGDKLTAGEDVLASGTEVQENTLRYIKGRPLTEEERLEQAAYFECVGEAFVPPTVESDLDDGTPIVYGTSASSVDFREYVTVPKEQGVYNDCWAYSIASLYETSLLSQGLGSYDLSEEHLAYFWANRQNDPLGNTPNDKNVKNTNYHDGGNTWLASLFLSSWSGMAQDYKYPVPTTWDYYSSSQKALLAYDTDAYLRDAVFSQYSVSRVKTLLQQYKSVSVFIYMPNSSYYTYYNADTAAYSCPKKGSVNHAVTIVGWDDSYEAENFNPNSGVTGDGAWIVKNSWGTGFADEGYFYVSYQDNSLQTVTAVSAAASVSYPNNYMYDGSTSLSTTNVEPGDSVAVIFKARAGNGLAESLGEIVTCSASDNARYRIKIYVGLSDTNKPVNGTLAYSGTVMQPYAGVCTIPLDREVEIAPDSYYSVILTNISSTDSFNYYVEMPVVDKWYSTQAGLQEGQGFKYNGRWYDCGASFSFCPRIKAHTRTESYTPSVTAPYTTLSMTQGGTSGFVPTTTPSTYASLGFTYTSSDSSVVSVDTNGQMTARKGGKAVITAVCKKAPALSVSCTVTVAPFCPTSVKATLNSYNSITVSWDAVDGVSGYELFRREGDTGADFSMRVRLSGNTFTDKDEASQNCYILPNINYQYYVRSYVTVDGGMVYSENTTAVSVKTRFQVNSLSVKVNNQMYNEISWKKISGANGYVIYRYYGGKWNWLKTIFNPNTLTYKDKKITPLTAYKYRIVPFRIIENVRYYGGSKTGVWVYSSPAKQSINSLTVKSSGIMVRWTPQTGSSGYVVYRKLKGGSFKKIALISNGNKGYYADKGATAAGTYIYAVKAYRKESYGGTVYSQYTTKTVKRS